jgi:hypothetical protein
MPIAKIAYSPLRMNTTNPTTIVRALSVLIKVLANIGTFLFLVFEVITLNPVVSSTPAGTLSSSPWRIEKGYLRIPLFYITKFGCGDRI